jgi:hypothetical protein
MAVKSVTDIGAAARATLVGNLAVHLAALARPLPLPGSFDLVPTRDAIRRVEGAACGVSVPATSGEPRRSGDGHYDATFVLSVALFHENTSATPLLTATGDYAAAITECLVQRPSLGGVARTVDWLGQSVDLVGDALTPSTLGLAVVEFAVLVENVVDLVPPAVTRPTVTSTFPSVTVR